jgi:hypothetical protein
MSSYNSAAAMRRSVSVRGSVDMFVADVPLCPSHGLEPLGLGS